MTSKHKSLLQIMLPLLQTEDTDPIGQLNHRLVQMSLRDATGNPQQFKMSDFVESAQQSGFLTPMEQLALYGPEHLGVDLRTVYNEDKYDSQQIYADDKYSQKDYVSAFVPPRKNALFRGKFEMELDTPPFAPFFADIKDARVRR